MLNDVLDAHHDGWPATKMGCVDRHSIVKVDCVECSSQRALIDTILNQLPRVEPASSSTIAAVIDRPTASSGAAAAAGTARAAAATSWIRGERGIPQLLDALRIVCFQWGYRVTIIFDRAERLRELDPRFLASMLRINELLACGNGDHGLSKLTLEEHLTHPGDGSYPGVLVILVSENEWRTFRDTGFGTGVVEPSIVSFPAYSKGAI